LYEIEIMCGFGGIDAEDVTFVIAPINGTSRVNGPGVVARWDGGSHYERGRRSQRVTYEEEVTSGLSVLTSTGDITVGTPSNGYASPSN
jgi:hypothetical protein